MTRRRLVALVSAIALGSLILVMVIAVLLVTRTDYGRNRLVRPILQRALATVVHGNVYIGKISGGFLTDVTIDSVAIRDARGDLFVSTGRVTVSYDPRDVADQRILIRHADVEHPYVHLTQHQNGVWNFQQIFPPSHNPPRPRGSPRSLGEYVVIDSIHARDGTFQLTLPWSPDDTLRGRALDSSIKVALERKDFVIRKTFDGYARTRAWTNAYAVVPHIRYADPDSDRIAGREVQIDTLNVNEFDPPFLFRNVRGVVRNLGDSVFFNTPHFDLPGSTGSGRGKIWWGHDLPTRYDIAIRGDSVALNDVNWVYPRLPRTGGGSMVLTIRHDPKNLHIVNFKLANMDVRSTKSHLTGDMTFGTGAPVLLVRDVNLRADPVDFDLLRTLNGGPFAEDWQGQLFGTAQGAGGPLTNFLVNASNFTWRDAHVRGAVSRLGGRGELDILDPAFTAFHHFDVDAASIDLRSIEYLFPSFPSLQGFVSGTATLDSSWLDVRFSNARLSHQDGPGPPSQVTGSGRVTTAVPYMNYDVALNASPLSWTTLARSYPMLPFRGLMSGPISAKGTTPALDLSASLQGAAGAMSFQGVVDIDSTVGYGARGNGQFSAIDLQSLLERPSVPQGTLSGHYDLDLSRITVPGTRGVAAVVLDRSVFDSLRVLPSYAHATFADGKMRVDSLSVRTTAFRLSGDGAIGLPKGSSDTLRLSLDLDSLGGLRRYIGHPDTSVTGDDVVPDSLAGEIHVAATARGRLDSLDLTGRITGTGLVVRSSSIASVSGTFDLANALAKPTGTVAIRADTASVGWVKFDTLGASARIAGRDSGDFAIGVETQNAQSMAAAGRLELTATGGSIRLDSASFNVNHDLWRLAGPASIRRDSGIVRVDSLIVRNADSASISVSLYAPDSGAASGVLSALAIPLSDAGVALQLQHAVSGRGDFSATVAGTSANPVITMSSDIRGLQSGSANIERVASTAQYDQRRLTGAGDIFRGGRRGVHVSASLPVAITLFSARRLPDSLHATVQADSADLGVLQALGLPVESTSGRLTADLDIGGTWGTGLVPRGQIAVNNGAMTLTRFNGQRLTSIDADIRADGRDSLVIKQLRASSDAGPRGNTVSVNGSIERYLDPSARLNLALAAKEFHVESKGVAKLDLSTSLAGTQEALTLRGTKSSDTLQGPITIDRGQLYLPDPTLAQKQINEAPVDSNGIGASGTAPASFFDEFLNGLVPSGLSVTLSDQVRLQSPDADVPLAGSLSIIKVPPAANAARTGFFSKLGLAPQGILSANRGSYRLNLGLVLRDFSVQGGGTVKFDGTLPINPLIDLKALYVVKQVSPRPDIGVFVNVDGPLDPGPKLTFSSDQSYEISQSDLISYLVAGQPGFLGDNPDVARTVLSVLTPTLSDLAQQSLMSVVGGVRGLGSLLQQVQLQVQGGAASTTGGNSSAQNALTSFAYGSTLGAQVQITNNLSVGLSTGLCSFNPQSSYTRSSTFESFGGSLQYRLGNGGNPITLQAGREPSTTARYCGQGYNGVISTPSQLSLSLSRIWRF